MSPRMPALSLFPPTRTAALERLNAFIPKAGRDYARLRNFDLAGHPHVSCLSPYLRCRLITEEDALTATLRRHSLQASEKFVQEVFWRTYWKGWLEMRPSVWSAYKTELRRALNDVQTQSGLRQRWEAACSGQTGIDCFDAWAVELAQTGYLHNHARMWFASIWIFTLNLPWTLGADFFLRHLLDGDPASNTLGWRWVAGLQTRGKTYLARPDNIAKYTEGRFQPRGLAETAIPLEGSEAPPRMDLSLSGVLPRDGKVGLLITPEDLSLNAVFEQGVQPETTLCLDATEDVSPLMLAPHVSAFAQSAMADVTERWRERLGKLAPLATSCDKVLDWARAAELDHIITLYPPVGPHANAIAAINAHIPVHKIARTYDQVAWPHATHGFFRFKDKIPKLVAGLKGLAAA